MSQLENNLSIVEQTYATNLLNDSHVSSCQRDFGKYKKGIQSEKDEPIINNLIANMEEDRE